MEVYGPQTAVYDFHVWSILRGEGVNRKDPRFIIFNAFYGGNCELDPYLFSNKLFLVQDFSTKLRAYSFKGKV